jgi:hypothetical protein
LFARRSASSSLTADKAGAHALAVLIDILNCAIPLIAAPIGASSAYLPVVGLKWADLSKADMNSAAPPARIAAQGREHQR